MCVDMCVSLYVDVYKQPIFNRYTQFQQFLVQLKISVLCEYNLRFFLCNLCGFLLLLCFTELSRMQYKIKQWIHVTLNADHLSHSQQGFIRSVLPFGCLCFGLDDFYFSLQFAVFTSALTECSLSAPNLALCFSLKEVSFLFL